MRFKKIPFLAALTPSGGGGGSGLTIVQQPAKVETWGNNAQRSLSPVGNGNHLIVAARGETSKGAPTITDSAGGSWGAPVHSYPETGSNSTAYYYIRTNVTSGLTWVDANFGSGGECCIGVVEVSGSAPVLDAPISGTFTSLTDPWNIGFTSTANNAVVLGLAVFSNSTTVTDVAPIDSDGTSEYFAYFRGLFPTMGSNTAVLDLNDGRQGAYSGIVVKGS